MKQEFLNICFDQCFIFIISCTFYCVLLFQDFSKSMKASMYFKKQSLSSCQTWSMTDMMNCSHSDRWSFSMSDESLLEADDFCIRTQSRLHFSLFCQFNAQIILSLTRLFKSFSFFLFHFQHIRKSWIVIKYDFASTAFLTCLSRSWLNTWISSMMLQDSRMNTVNAFRNSKILRFFISVNAKHYFFESSLTSRIW